MAKMDLSLHEFEELKNRIDTTLNEIAEEIKGIQKENIRITTNVKYLTTGIKLFRSEKCPRDKEEEKEILLDSEKKNILVQTKIEKIKSDLRSIALKTGLKMLEVSKVGEVESIAEEDNISKDKLLNDLDKTKVDLDKVLIETGRLAHLFKRKWRR